MIIQRHLSSLKLRSSALQKTVCSQDQEQRIRQYFTPSSRLYLLIAISRADISGFEGTKQALIAMEEEL
jgi:hypothetical protein